MAFAAGYDDVPFAHTTNSDHAQKLEISKPYGFVIFRNFDEGHKFNLRDEPMNFQEMKDYLEEHRFPFATEFDQDAANRIFGSQKNALIYLNDDHSHESLIAFKQFAKDNQKEDLVFTYSEVSNGFGKRLAEYIGVK